jgi:Domain of unknown function (DUF4304)
VSQPATINSRAVDKALRDVFWRSLKDRGFERRTGRTAWRDHPGCIQTINVQSFNRYLADRMGATTVSFAVNLGVFYPVVAQHSTAGAFDRDPTRPTEPHCQARFHLSKGLSQPGPDVPLPPPAVGRPPDPRPWVDRPDVWYVVDDGSNVDDVVADARDRILEIGLPWLERLSDLSEARRSFREDGTTSHAPGITAESYGGALGCPARWQAIGALSIALADLRGIDEAIAAMADQRYYQERPADLDALRTARSALAAARPPVDSEA